MKSLLRDRELIRVLILEDVENDYELIKLTLRQAEFDCKYLSAKTKEEFISGINESIDIILADFNLPQFNALEALSILKEKKQRIPFILVTGTLTEEVAVECMKQGADDYILKSNLTRLPAAVENAIHNKRLEEDREKALIDLENSEHKFHDLYQYMPFPVIIYDPDNFRIFDVNEAATKLYGFSKEEFLQISLREIRPKEEVNKLDSKKKMYFSDKPSFLGEWKHMNKWGKTFEVEINNYPIKINDRYARVSIINNISERKRTSEALNRSERKYRSMYNDAPIGISNVDSKGIIINANDAFSHMLGYENKDEIIGISMLEITHPDDRNASSRYLMDLVSGIKKNVHFEKRYVNRTGEIVWANVTVSAIYNEDGKFLYTISMIEDITRRIKNEKALRESEKKYKELADFLPQIVFETDNEGRLIYINKHGAEALGYPKEYIYSNPFVMSFIHPDDRPVAIINFNKNLKGEEGPGREYRLLSNDGSFVESIIYSSPVWKEKKVGGIRGIVVDVSALKRMEKDLRESELKYRTLFEKNFAAVFKCSLGGKLIDCNEAFSKMYGFSTSEEVLKNDERNFSFEKLVKDSIIPKIAGKKELNNLELMTKKKNGDNLWVLGNIGLIKNEIENNFSIQGTLIDITDKKKAEEQAMILVQALTEISESVVMTDKEQNIIFVNDAFCNQYGYSLAEIIGQKSIILDSDKNSVGLQEQIFVATQKGGWTGELINRTKNGNEFPIHLSTKRIEDKYTGSITYISISHDISEQKESEATLKAAKERAEDMSNLKSIFLANMSHELRTPMIGILGYAGMIQDDTLDLEIKEMAGAIVKSANRLTETLNLILDLSKVEANKMDIRFHKVGLVGIITDVVNHYKIASKEKGIYLKLSVEEENLYSMLDERLFSQVIGNIVNNAVKYTVRGGVDVMLDREKDMVVIKISDTGIGISEKSIDLIFEPFRQASEGYNRKFEGTGLGLTISKKFVELMKGKIEVISKINKGSIFTIKFPLVPGLEKGSTGKREEKFSISEEEKQIDGKNNPNILLVEDDQINANVIHLFLRNYGNMDHSTSASRAIEMINEKKYDVILMDINLKGMSGLEAVKIIKQHKDYKEVPVVAVTAYAMAGDKQRFLSNGCTHYLPKPFTKKVIIDLLNSILVN